MKSGTFIGCLRNSGAQTSCLEEHNEKQFGVHGSCENRRGCEALQRACLCRTTCLHPPEPGFIRNTALCLWERNPSLLKTLSK